MSNWKKLITSGSDANLNTITASSGISASGHLFASLSLSPNNTQFVTIDTASGQFYYSDTASSPPTTNLESLSFTSIVVDSTNTPYIYSPSIVSFTQDDTTPWKDVNIDGDTNDSIDFNSYTSTKYRISTPSIGVDRFDALNVIFNFGNPVIVSEFRTTFGHNSSTDEYEMPLQIHVYGKNTEFESGESDGVLLGEGARPGAGGIGLTWSGPSSNPLNIYGIGQGNNLNRTSSIPETSLTSSFQYYKIRYFGNVYDSPDVYQSTKSTTINQITPVTRSFQASGTSLEVNNGVLNVTQIITNTLIGDVIGDLQGTASYANVANYAVTSSHLPEFSVFNGNRPITNQDFADIVYNEQVIHEGMYGKNFGTSGSLTEFIEKMFFPNTPPIISPNPQNASTIQEFDTDSNGNFPYEGYQVLGNDDDIADGDPNQTLTYSLTDDFFQISSTGFITLKSGVEASLDFNNNPNSPFHTGNARLLSVNLIDGAGGVTSGDLWIKVSPNAAPNLKILNGLTPVPNHPLLANTFIFTGSINTISSLPETNPEGALGLYSKIRYEDANDDFVNVDMPDPLNIYTNPNGDAVFSGSIKSNYKQIEIHQVSSSLDFDDKSHYDFPIHFTDVHGAQTTLLYHIEIENDPPPTINANQVFTCNEHIMTASIADNRKIGDISSTQNSEDDSFTIFTGFNLVSAQLDNGLDIKTTLTTSDILNVNDLTEVSNIPSKDPFEIDQFGKLSIKNTAGLNSRIANKYVYSVTVTDALNIGHDSNTNNIQINIEPDNPPQLSSNGNPYIIESSEGIQPVKVGAALPISSQPTYEIRENSQNHSNKLSIEYKSNPVGYFGNLVPTSLEGANIFPLAALQSISGSTISHTTNNPVPLEITASKVNFPLSVLKTLVNISIYRNQPPVLSILEDTLEEQNNRIAYLATAGVRLDSVGVGSDPEGDDIDFNSIVLTSTPPNLLSTSHNGTDTIFINAASNLNSYAGQSISYSITIKDEHRFTTSNILHNTFTILNRDEITFTQTTATIDESAGTDITVVTEKGGTTETTIIDNLNDTTIFPGTPHITKFDITNSDGLEDIFEVIPVGGTFGYETHTFNIKTKSDLKGSIFNFDNHPSKTLTTEVTFDNEVTEAGPTINLAINKNDAPILSDSIYNGSFYTTETTWNTNSTRASGDPLFLVDLFDPEGDTIPKNSTSLTQTFTDNARTTSNINHFEVTNTLDASVASVKVANGFNSRIFPGTYNFTISSQDIHGFRTSTFSKEITIITPPAPTVSTNGTVINNEHLFYITKNTSSNAPVMTSFGSGFNQGVGGSEGTILVEYANLYGGARLNTTTPFQSDNPKISVELVSGNGLNGNPATARIIFIGKPKNNGGNVETANITIRDNISIHNNVTLLISVAVKNPTTPNFTINGSSNMDLFITENTGSGAPLMDDFSEGEGVHGDEAVLEVDFSEGQGAQNITAVNETSDKIAISSFTNNTATIKFDDNPKTLGGNSYTIPITITDNHNNSFIQNVDVSVKTSPTPTFTGNGATADGTFTFFISENSNNTNTFILYNHPTSGPTSQNGKVTINYDPDNTGGHGNQSLVSISNTNNSKISTSFSGNEVSISYIGSIRQLGGTTETSTITFTDNFNRSYTQDITVKIIESLDPTITSNGDNDFDFYISENSPSDSPLKGDESPSEGVHGNNAIVTINYNSINGHGDQSLVSISNTNNSKISASFSGNQVSLFYVGNPKNDVSTPQYSTLTFTDNFGNTDTQGVYAHIIESPSAVITTNNISTTDFGFHINEKSSNGDSVRTTATYAAYPNQTPLGSAGKIIATYPNIGHGGLDIKSSNAFISDNANITVTQIGSTNEANITYTGDADTDSSPQTATITITDNQTNTQTQDISVAIFANSKPTWNRGSQRITQFPDNGQITKDQIIFQGVVTETEGDRPYTATLSGTDSSKYSTAFLNEFNNNSTLQLILDNNITDTSGGTGITHSLTVTVTDSTNKTNAYSLSITYASKPPRVYAYRFSYSNTNQVDSVNLKKLGFNFGTSNHGYNNYDTTRNDEYQTAPIEVVNTQIVNDSLMDGLIESIQGSSGIGEDVITGTQIGGTNTSGTTSYSAEDYRLDRLAENLNITNLEDSTFEDNTVDNQGISELGNLNLLDNRINGKLFIMFPSSSLLVSKPNGMAEHADDDPDIANTFKMVYRHGTPNVGVVVDPSRVMYFNTNNYIYGYNRWGAILVLATNSQNTKHYMVSDEQLITEGS